MAMAERADQPPQALETVLAARADRESQLGFWLLMLPTLVFLAIFFAYPMMDTLLRSFGAPDHFPTIANYTRAFERTVYARLLLNTAVIAASVTITTLLLAYPLAYVMSAARPMVVKLITVFVLLPFFTSVLVRTYGWMIILNPHGLLNAGLAQLGLGPVKLMYNRWGVIIGMTYTLLPYMVMTLYSVFRGIDRNLLRAAHNLGASNWKAFRRVFFPLSLPGVTGGGLLVFIMALGYFITPALMGGSGDEMISMVIYDQVGKSLNWEFASALGVLLLVVTTLGFVLYGRLVGLRMLLESRT